MTTTRVSSVHNYALQLHLQSEIHQIMNMKFGIIYILVFKNVLRFNATSSGPDDDNMDLYNTLYFRIDPIRKIIQKNYDRVVKKGFVQIQTWLDNAIG